MNESQTKELALLEELRDCYARRRVIEYGMSPSGRIRQAQHLKQYDERIQQILTLLIEHESERIGSR